MRILDKYARGYTCAGQDKVDFSGGGVGGGAEDLHGDAEGVDHAGVGPGEGLAVLVKEPAVGGQGLDAHHTLHAVFQPHEDPEAGEAGDRAGEDLAHMPLHEPGQIELFDLPLGALGGDLPL